MKIYSLSSLPLSLSFHFTISCGKVEIESTKNAFTSAKLVIVAKTFFLFLFLLFLLVEEKYGWTNKGKMDVGVKVGGGGRVVMRTFFDAILAHQPRVSSPLFPQIGFSD